MWNFILLTALVLGKQSKTPQKSLKLLKTPCFLYVLLLPSEGHCLADVHSYFFQFKVNGNENYKHFALRLSRKDKLFVSSDNFTHCHDLNNFPLVTLLIKLLMQLQLVDPHWNVICSQLSKVVYFSTKVLYKNYMKQVHLKFRKVYPPFKCCRF